MCFIVLRHLWIFMSDHNKKSIIMAYNQCRKYHNKKIYVRNKEVVLQCK